MMKICIDMQYEIEGILCYQKVFLLDVQAMAFIFAAVEIKHVFNVINLIYTIGMLLG